MPAGARLEQHSFVVRALLYRADIVDVLARDLPAAAIVAVNAESQSIMFVLPKGTLCLCYRKAP